MPEIVDVAEEFRKRARKNEQQSAQQLIERYKAVYGQIKDDVADVARRIQQARDAGEEVNQAWLFQNIRLQNLQDYGNIDTFWNSFRFSFASMVTRRYR